MEKEIETRFLDIDKENLVNILNMLGADDLGNEKLDEIIFYDEKLTWVGKEKFVRLRKTKGKIKLTYKHNDKQTVDSAREIEVEVSDMDKCSELLQNIGLKIIRRLEKYRHSFKFGDVIVDIDTWPKIPVYAEIEGPTIESLEEVALHLGFDWEKRFDGNARQVYSHYGYEMDKLPIITFKKFE